MSAIRLYVSTTGSAKQERKHSGEYAAANTERKREQLKKYILVLFPR